ncbi:MAG: hypothetical protein BM557_07140 [Flavobacterium sp. MedPE-SWcel]|uniref:DUF418 domain-containing protein n=1 Tax=uncultured Flavobacterium sp. TaxID=165435 RepID=UPI00091F226D|nr:DUF418 domain-containing protein [uncultured Flavobacterium sp.]OIQ18688.1 MAG: hypothetical protein BM557_07140 [Flavobacterium sp. MedPE-SWcel]
MGKRVIGLDVARALAIIGMIIVNFKVILGSDSTNWVKNIANIFDGKAAATFVVLAGVGLALMTNSAIKSNDDVRLKALKIRIAKRALFLFVVGLSYIAIWPADILHFYGIYMLVILLFLTKKQNTILLLAGLFIIAFPLLLMFFNYESGWDFTSLSYSKFWTINGFIRNLFFNGFHPVVPWVAFMLVGYWFGKQNLNDNRFIKKMLLISAIAFVIIQLLSYSFITILSNGDIKTTKELTEILGTNPMPPMPLYMLNGISIAIAIISACILLSKQFERNKMINALEKTGQLALTFYVAHIVIGIGLIEIINPEKIGVYSIQFSVLYALSFSFFCIIFAIIWRKFKTSGPLEWIMRKLTD